VFVRGLTGEIPLCKYGKCCANFQIQHQEKPAGISRLRRALCLGLAMRPVDYSPPPAAAASQVQSASMTPDFSPVAECKWTAAAAAGGEP